MRRRAIPCGKVQEAASASASIGNWLLRRRVPLEDEAPARLVMGGIWPEEIDPHPFQFLGAIARERGFVPPISVEQG